MQQSNVIFANLFIAYFLFITLRGELPTYITLLRGGGQSASGTSNGGVGGDFLGSNPVTNGAAALLGNNADILTESNIGGAVGSMSESNANQILGLFQ